MLAAVMFNKEEDNFPVTQITEGNFADGKNKDNSLLLSSVDVDSCEIKKVKSFDSRSN